MPDYTVVMFHTDYQQVIPLLMNYRNLEKLEDKSEDLTVSATKNLDSALAHIEELQAQSRETTATIRKHLKFKNLPKKS